MCHSYVTRILGAGGLTHEIKYRRQMTGGMTTTPVLVPVSGHVATPMFVIGTRYQPNSPRGTRIFKEGDVKDRGGLFAFDVDSGTEQWHLLADSLASFFSDPTVFSIGGRTRYAHSNHAAASH